MAESVALKHLTQAQWRVLNRLHNHAGLAKPVVDCRGLLAQQGAEPGDLLALEAEQMVEGLLPGETIRFADLSEANWRAMWQKYHRYMVRITPVGRDTVFGQPQIMVIRDVGRRHRYTVKDVNKSVSLSDEDLLSTLDAMYDDGLIYLINANGEQVSPSRADLRNYGTNGCRIKLTRKAGTYLPRKG